MLPVATLGARRPPHHYSTNMAETREMQHTGALVVGHSLRNHSFKLVLCLLLNLHTKVTVQKFRWQSPFLSYLVPLVHIEYYTIALLLRAGIEPKSGHCLC